MAKRTQRSSSEEHDTNTPNGGDVSSGAKATEAPAHRKPGPRPGTDAAKRGGTAAREKYGRDFYRRIGAKGGSTVRERYGSSFYTEIGRRGGEATKRHLGIEHYARIGHIGGKRAHGMHGTDGEASTIAADNASR